MPIEKNSNAETYALTPPGYAAIDFGAGTARRRGFPRDDTYRDGVMTLLVDDPEAVRRVRPVELRVHEQQWGRNWFRTERMFGGRCYPDRFAGNLAGIRDDIGYFRELGITFLHLLGVVVGEPGDRRVSPSLGSADRLADLASDLHLAGIALALDLPVCDAGDAAKELLWLAGLGVDAFIASGSEADVAELRDLAAAVAPSAVVIGAGGELDVASPDDALIWQALASGDARVMQRSLERRGDTPRLVAVRDENALGWQLTADDAPGRDLDEHAHFLAGFYAGDTLDSFAHGVREPGAGVVSGTTASLAGLTESDDNPAAEDRVVLAHAIALALGGVPMLYLGDEVGQLSDPTYADDPERRGDIRWIHRGNRPRDRYFRKRDADTAPGRIFRRITKLVSIRRVANELGGSDLVAFQTGAPGILGFLRHGEDTSILVFANVASTSSTITPRELSGLVPEAYDLVDDSAVNLARGLTLPGYGFAWLRVSLRSAD